jgi:ATP/maltotriose-dependent transcriptional regulator MalT
MPASDALERGRQAYERRRWGDARGSLEAADRASPLGADDLELLGTALYMLGRDDESLAVFERQHHAHLDAGEPLLAARRAIWIGINFALRGETGPATGWLGRAQRLLEESGQDSVERGYALLPLIFRHEAAGDLAAAAATGGQAVTIAQRFDDRDLFALAAQAQGSMLIADRKVEEGLALLDEAMVVAMGGELSPIVTGIVYCGVILACQAVYELRRAQEWTQALTRWCDEQEDLMAFTGRCLVHRAEVLQVHGDWAEALAEAKRATVRLVEVGNLPAAGLAYYRVGELQRLRGELAEAEESYTHASRYGWEPQPGLALLRLAQGRTDAAVASIRRVLAETSESLKRAGLLPGAVEILLAAGEADEARRACEELEQITESFESGMLGALVAHARGAVELEEGDARGALVRLRAAAQAWQELGAPYEVGRVRLLVGQACRALGDDDAATLELEAAREAFERLGARPELERLAEPAGWERAADHGLTARELEVLRLVAAGRSNREIAAALVISEHTVARHVQNIFMKLRLSSRTAATAFAFEHDLV